MPSYLQWGIPLKTTATVYEMSIRCQMFPNNVDIVTPILQMRD